MVFENGIHFSLLFGCHLNSEAVFKCFDFIKTFLTFNYCNSLSLVQWGSEYGTFELRNHSVECSSTSSCTGLNFPSCISAGCTLKLFIASISKLFYIKAFDLKWGSELESTCLVFKWSKAGQRQICDLTHRIQFDQWYCSSSIMQCRWAQVRWGRIGILVDGQAGPCMGRCMG